MTDSKVLLFVGRSGNGITSTINSMFIGLNARGSRAEADNRDGDGTDNQGAEATGGQEEDLTEGQGREVTSVHGEEFSKGQEEEVMRGQEEDVKGQSEEAASGHGEEFTKDQEELMKGQEEEGAKGQSEEAASGHGEKIPKDKITILNKILAFENSVFQVREEGFVIAVDGYGLAEPKADLKIANEKLDEDVIQMFNAIKGFVAIILVLKYGVRFTKQEQDSVALVKERFGQSIFQKRGIIVLTHGDNFELDNDENNSDAFKNWCESQGGAFCNLLQECRNRIVLFNNKTSNLAQQQQQSDELLRHVETVQQENPKLYSMEDLKLVSKNKRRAVETTVDISDEQDADNKTPLLGKRTHRTYKSVVDSVETDPQLTHKCTNYDCYFFIFYLVLVAGCVTVELLVLRHYNII